SKEAIKFRDKEGPNKRLDDFAETTNATSIPSMVGFGVISTVDFVIVWDATSFVSSALSHTNKKFTPFALIFNIAPVRSKIASTSDNLRFAVEGISASVFDWAAARVVAKSSKPGL